MKGSLKTSGQNRCLRTEVNTTCYNMTEFYPKRFITTVYKLRLYTKKLLFFKVDYIIALNSFGLDILKIHSQRHLNRIMLRLKNMTKNI